MHRRGLQRRVAILFRDVRVERFRGSVPEIPTQARRSRVGDDMREAPSRVVVDELLSRGAEIVAYDPVAMTEARRVFADRPKLSYAEAPMEALEGADALLIVTEWKEFRSPDFARIKQLLKQPLVIDGRNLYEPRLVRGAGLEYQPIGRA